MAQSQGKYIEDGMKEPDQQPEYRRKLELEIRTVEKQIKHLQTIVPEQVIHEENELEKIEEALRHELSLARVESNDAQKRLKKVTRGSKSTKDTTGSDISIVRPPHIAAKFSEIFKKEWTNAYQSMKETEKNCVTRLLNVLKDVYTRCEALANDDFLQQVQGCIELPFDCPEISNEPIVMPDLLKHQIKEFRKSRAPVAIAHMQENMVATFQIDTGESLEIQSYVSRCIEVCWLMVIQDPPMVFEYGSSDGLFEKTVFREYTKRGEYVDFIVWPAILLHDKGPMVSKGIAQQGCKKKTDVTDSVPLTHLRDEAVLKEELTKVQERETLFKSKVQNPTDHIRDLKQKHAERKRALRAKITKENEKTNDLMTRLSQIASGKLRDNNPNVLDLSDENRPSKIAEKLSELYDDEWTDAYNVLEASEPETRIIEILFDVLKDAYHECASLSSEHYFQRIQCCIESPIKVQRTSEEPLVMPDILKQQIKEFRKRRAVHNMKHIQKEVSPQIQIQNAESPEIESYVSRCIEVCWLMVIQDPPMVFEYGSSDGLFEKTVFREYTKRGEYVDFIVWPAILLHNKEPMVSKGIAQGCKKKTHVTDSLHL